MKINELYVIGGENFEFTGELDKNSKVVFLDKAQDGFDNQLLLLKNFLESQSILRQKWLMFQEEVFKKLRNKIENDDDFQYILYNIFLKHHPTKLIQFIFF